jgi:F-type H+-transporting ATPase subunit b
MVMIMGFAAFCMAAEGHAAMPLHQPEGETPHFGNWFVIGWTAVNFFVLLALMYKFAYGPINAMLEQRSNTIESSLKHAEEVKTEVEQMRKETQTNLAESRKEAQEIVARATKAADDAKNEIINKAKEDANSIKTKAEAEIKAATEQAKMELKDTAASLALIAAERVLGRAITEDDHKNMVKQFVNEAGDLLC